MRTLLTSLALAATLTACASAGGAGAPGLPSADRGRSSERWEYARQRPLDAHIIPTSHSGLSFSLSRPAHVAVFEVVPGQGVGLVYPSYGGQRELLGAGYHNPLLGGTDDFRWAYRDATPYTRLPQPRYIYLIASERPLDVGEFVRNPTALRSTFGLSRFASWNAHQTLDDLDALVVRGVGPEQWTSDLYVIWPETRQGNSYAQQQVVIRCSDGRAVLVPLRYAALACPNDTRSRAQPAAGDSTGDLDDGKPTVRRRRPPAGEVEKGSDGDAADAARNPREVRPNRPETRREEPRRVEPRTEPRRVEPRSEPRRVEPSSDAAPSSTPPEPRTPTPVRGATRDPAR